MNKPRNCSEEINTRTATIVVPLNAAGVDVADVPFARLPKDAVITKAGILPQATYIGHADGSVWLVEVGETAIATATYTDVATPPAVGAFGSFGAITNAKQLEGAVLSYSITNGTGAANPACVLVVEYEVI